MEAYGYKEGLRDGLPIGLGYLSSNSPSRSSSSTSATPS